jgi:hypothetical protein
VPEKYNLTKRDIAQLKFIRWVLFVINGASAAGIEKITRARVHSILFMSFSASPYYDIEPLRQRAQRTPQGPYYREAHIALGALTLSGLIDLTEYEGHLLPKTLQFDGVFKPTALGLSVGKHLRETITGNKLYSFILDLCLGFAAVLPEDDELELQSTTLDDILDNDLSYKDAMKRPGNFLDVAKSGDFDNATLGGLKAIDSRLRNKTIYNSRDILAAYQRLLRKRIA